MSGFWNGRGGVLAAGLASLLLLSAAPGDVHAGDEDLRISTVRLIVGEDGSWSYDSNGALSGTELGQMIETEIGAGNYQSTTVVLGTCHSGAGLESVKSGLSGTSRVISSCNSAQTTQLKKSKDGELEGFLPGFYDSLGDDPDQPVRDLIEDGKENDPRYPSTPEKEAAEKKRYERYVEYVKSKNEEREKEGKPPLQEPPSWEDGGRERRLQEPQTTQSADDPLGSKLASGQSSNHAIIYQSSSGGLREEQLEKAKAGLTKAGFTSIDVLTPVNKADRDAIEAAAEDGRIPSLRSDAATPENLQARLAQLKSEMNPEESLTVIVHAHGSVLESSQRSDLGVGPGGGERFDDNDRNDRIGDYALASLLAEEALYADGSNIFDSPLLTRWGQPTLTIQTADEGAPSGRPTAVSMNGVHVGDLLLGTVVTGQFPGRHSLSLSDQVIAKILDGTDYSDGFSLEFAFGGPSDYFALATPQDLVGIGLGFGFGTSGISLTLAVEDQSVVVPLPASGSLLLIGLAGLARITARRRS